MADPFAMTLPAGRAEEVSSLMAEHDRTGMSDEDLQKRLGRMGAKQAPVADPIIEKMARLAEQRRAMREIIGQKSPQQELRPRTEVPEQGVMSGQYETKLPPDQEAVFQVWKRQYAPRDSGADYDLRGAFKAGLKPAANGHWPDTFKKPNHPTFSNESIYAKARPELAGSWKGEQYVPSAERVEPGVLGFTRPAIDPVDVLTGGILGKGGAAAAKTGISEAIGTGASKLMGMAGLPPIVQQVLGLGAGLLPIGSAFRRPNAEVPPRPLARVPDEVLPPLPPQPPRQIGQAPPSVPATIPPEYIPPRFNAPRSGEFGAARDLGVYNPDQIGAQQRLAAPQLRLPPPTIRVGPEGAEKFSELPQSVARQRQRRTFQTLTEPSVSAKRTSRGVQPFESGRGTQPPGEPGPRTEIPPTLEEQQAEIASIPQQLPEILKRYGVTEPEIARQQFGNVARGVFTSRPEEINPWGIPGIRDVQRQVRQFGREQLPSRGTFNRADFADRLERQRVRDTATISEGRRRGLTTGQSQVRGRLHAASQLERGDKVMTPQGPGTIIERVKGAITGRSINEIMASRGTRAEGRQQNWQTESYATAPSASARVKLDDGREGTWSAWNLLRLKEEPSSVGPIQQLTVPERAKIKGLKPKRELGRLVAPEPQVEAAPEPEAGDDFDWATGEFKKR